MVSLGDFNSAVSPKRPLSALKSGAACGPGPRMDPSPRRSHAANPSPPSIASKIAAGSHQLPATQSIQEPDAAGGAACLPFSEVGAVGAGAGTGTGGVASGAAA